MRASYCRTASGVLAALALFAMAAGCSRGKTKAAGRPGAASYGRPSSCQANLKAIATATVMYSVDYSRLPQAARFTDFWGALGPYLKLQTQGVSMICPETRQRYLLNTAISGRQMASAANLPMLRDAAPHADGKVYVAYPSGIVMQVLPTDPRLAGCTFK